MPGDPEEDFTSGGAVGQFSIREAKTSLVKVQRSGRGSLRGKLVLVSDWDSTAVNESIAADFGVTSEAAERPGPSNPSRGVRPGRRRRRCR
jgi:hypothetical protein